jgi:uncharacterized protein (TIGR00251 family)
MIALESHAGGVVLPVHAQPGARRNAIRGEQNGALKVAVTQIPEKGKANRAIIELLAKSLRLRKSQIELLSGEASGHKRFLVRGISSAAMQQILDQLLAKMGA